MIFKLLKNTIYCQPFKTYLIAVIVFVLTIFFLRIFKNYAIKKLEKISKKTKTDLDNFFIESIKSINWFFYLALAFWISLQLIKLPNQVEKYFSYLVFIIIVFQILKIIQGLINFFTTKLTARQKIKDKKIDPSIIAFLNKFLKIIVWAAAILLTLQNLGVNVTAIMAGFGIGGVAIAFALQNILGDIFACFSIFFDKPFAIGDFIVFDGEMGTVKKIGIKSTRIQTLQGEELVVSNKELTEKKVHNYKRMNKRRIQFCIGVAYETPFEKLKKIPSIIEKIIKETQLAELDRIHFKEFGDFSLNFEVVYYVLSPDYNDFMDTQQTINFALKEAFAKEKIEFAYPTQTIFINNKK